MANERELAMELQASKSNDDEWGDAVAIDLDASGSAKRRLSAMVSVRLTEEELASVQARAQERDMSVSSYLRQLVLEDAGPSDANDTPADSFVLSSGVFYVGQVNGPAGAVDGRYLITSG